MSRGIASLRRYQGGGRVDPPPKVGVASLPQSPLLSQSWSVIDQLSPEVVAKMTPQEKIEWFLLKEFDRLKRPREAISATPPREPMPGTETWANRSTEVAMEPSAYDVREEFARRNPDAPTGSTYEKGYGELSGYRSAKERPGSYESYFPEGEHISTIERDLFDIMGPPITAEEIAQAWDDPMFGGTGRMSDLEWAGEVGNDLSDLSNQDLKDRVWARRYANRQIGSPRSMQRIRLRARFVNQFEPIVKLGPGQSMDEIFGHIGQEGPPPGFTASEYEDRLARLNRRNDLINAIDEIPDATAAPRSTPYRSALGQYFRDMPSRSPQEVQAYREQTRAAVRRGAARAGRGLKNVGVASLRAFRDRLPAMVAAGAATAATSHPVSALTDIAASPTQLGSGDLPGEYRDYGLYGPAPPSSLSYEDQLKYYENLQNQAAPLMPLRYRQGGGFADYLFPRQSSEPTMTRSYPGQQLRSRGPGR